MIAGLAMFAWLKARRDGYHSQAARRMRGTARVAVYGLCISAGFGFYGLRHARAETSERMTAVGRELESLSEMFGENNHMRINGENIYLSNGVSDEPMGAVLNRFEGYCREGKGVFSDIPKELGDPGNTALKLPDFSTVRNEDRKEGSVMCLVRGSESGAGFVDAAKKFAETKDLGAFGKLRFAYTSRLGNGQTHIMMLWTENSFRIDRLMPAAGIEGEGHDGVWAPRPPQSRRVMSIDMVGTEHAAYVYESSANKKEVSAFYDRQMSATGFVPVDDPTPGLRDPKKLNGSEYRLYVRDGQMVVMTANENATGSTSIGISETGISKSFAGVASSVAP
jgi:hypothetical protein